MGEQKKYLDGNQDDVLKVIAAGIEGGELGVAELRGLLDAEGAEKKRQKVLHLLSTELEKAANAAEDGANEDAPAKAPGKASRGEEIAEWKKAEYSGPLSGEQAEWRRKHLLDETGKYKVKK